MGEDRLKEEAKKIILDPASMRDLVIYRETEPRGMIAGGERGGAEPLFKGSEF